MKRLTVSLSFFLVLTVFSGTANGAWLDDLKKLGDDVQKGVVDAIDDVSKELDNTTDTENEPNKEEENNSKNTVTTSEPAKPAAAPNHNADKQLVLSAQQELKRLGYKISVDGAYGPGTQKTIQQFQKAQNIQQTGNVSPDLVATLKSTPSPAKAADTQKATEPAKTVAAPSTAAKTVAVTKEPAKKEKGFITKDGVRVFTGPGTSFEGGEHGFLAVAVLGGRTIKLHAFRDEKGAYINRFQTRIDSELSDCDRKSEKIFATLQVSGHEVNLVPSVWRGDACFLVSAKNSSVEEFLKAGVESQYVDLKITDSLLDDGYQGWYRIRNIDKPKPVQKVAVAQPKTSQQVVAEAVSEDVKNDPVFKQCNRHMVNAHYDCGCMANPPTDQKSLIISEEKLLRQKNFEAHLPREEQRYKNAVEKGVTGKQLEKARKKLDDWLDYGASIEHLSWENMDPNKKSFALTGKGFCKNEAGAKKYQFEQCTKRNKPPAGQSLDSHCTCVGEKYAELWLAEKRSLNSNVLVGLGSSSYSAPACR
jgi:peptidoglycan hydrolase-like protein with peptidoglycan-binding domain